jgi:metal-responsive CopG/Arc/MetJ family transcriptional regulator
VHQNKKVHRMTATHRKQGACFPADLWEAIERKAAAQKTTRSKIIVEAVRAMVERDSKRRTKK